MLIYVNDDSFEEEVIKYEGTVLVDFFANWCGPCKALSPIIEAIASELDGKVKVCKVDVDEAGATAASLGIMSIPTVMVFKNGEAAGKHIGLCTADEIRQMVG